ncbi:MAG: glycoside hydrolase family 2, partial [Alistipes sp.]|nr:glycoside hydrolase family 2 [Candidatus Minthomonas equi]
MMVFSCKKTEPSPRVVEDFNFGWKFALGDDALRSSQRYDDSSWRELHLPHDWSIEGEFDAANPSTPSCGSLPGGIGWYRKTFITPEIHGRVFLEFDGIFMNSTVYV